MKEQASLLCFVLLLTYHAMWYVPYDNLYIKAEFVMNDNHDIAVSFCVSAMFTQPVQ